MDAGAAKSSGRFSIHADAVDGVNGAKQWATNRCLHPRESELQQTSLWHTKQMREVEHQLMALRCQMLMKLSSFNYTLGLNNNMVNQSNLSWGIKQPPQALKIHPEQHKNDFFIGKKNAIWKYLIVFSAFWIVASFYSFVMKEDWWSMCTHRALLQVKI